MTTKQFDITLPDSLGSFANLSTTLNSAGINIEGGFEYSYQGKGHVCLITDNPTDTASTLDSAGIDYTSNDVVVTHIDNKPGALAGVTKAFADAGVNITSFYITMGSNQVFGVTDWNTASDIAKKLGVFVG